MLIQNQILNKRIAIVSYDDNRSKLIEWSYFNRKNLAPHTIIAHDTTAEVLTGTLNIPVKQLAGKNYGGYRQLAKMIIDQQIDILVCIGQPAAETNALTGIADLCALATTQGIIVASNEATADFIIHSLPGSVCTHSNGAHAGFAVNANDSNHAGTDHIQIEFLAN